MFYLALFFTFHGLAVFNLSVEALYQILEKT